jgi:type II secretory pathway pseudopilin PulG
MTLIIAVVGILGTLSATGLTQWLTGIREQQRLQIEGQREVRRQQEQRATADAERWQKERLANYSTLILALDSWSRIARHGAPETPEEIERLVEIRRQIGQTLYVTQLLTSSSVVDKTTTSIWMEIASLGVVRQIDEEAREDWRKADHAVLKQTIEMQQAMREELRIGEAINLPSDVSEDASKAASVRKSRRLGES